MYCNTYQQYNTNTTMEEMDCSSIFQTGDSAFASLDFLLLSEEETITPMGRTTQEDTTTDSAYRIQPQPPLNEDYSQLRIDDCITQQEVPVIPHGGANVNASASANQPTKMVVVDVMKSQNPSQAYLRISSKQPKSLDHHGPGWGCVYFGVILRRKTTSNGSAAFQEPAPDAVEYVAIKKLRKSVVLHNLKLGKKENPYTEILRMQTLGDNVHVLGCIEALQDQTHLYIIMPYCEQESLVECIPWKVPGGMGLPEEQARTYFQQILENILYLRSKGICHRDLSPDNCMLYNKRVVFTDLAMSFRIPLLLKGSTSQNTNDTANYVTPLGGFGKMAYLPPEVVLANLPFDAHTCDLWSSAIILFNLLTGEILYEQPHPENLLFRYFLLGKGISRTPVNERTTEILMELPDGDGQRTSLWNMAQKVLALDESVLDLLEGMLHIKSQERLTSTQIQAHAWMVR
jgi:serine/threonine protein kinase